MPRFRAVVLDVDSTLCALEGIDWLARDRGPEVSARIAELTEQAMDGRIPLESVYGERLGIVRPDAERLRQLAAQYVMALQPGARAAVRALREADVTVAVVSGGIRQALVPVVAELGLPASSLQAVELVLDGDGTYSGFDAGSPLTTDGGKEAIVRRLSLPRPALMVGDGTTDLAARPAVDAFAAFVGTIRRDPVVAAADYVLHSFDQLTRLVLS